MMLDPVELPVATVRTQKPRLASLARDLVAWFAVRASWLRARSVPVMFGVFGAVCMIASGHYLKQLANGDVPAALAPHCHSNVEPNYQGMDQGAARPHAHHHHHQPVPRD